MEIKNLQLPIKLVELINRGIWQKISSESLAMAIPEFTDPIELLSSIKGIEGISSYPVVLESEWFKTKSSLQTGLDVKLPLLDFDKSLIIAANRIPGDDIAVALDYREDENNPRVVASIFEYGDDSPKWKVIYNSFDEFYDRLEYFEANSHLAKSPPITQAYWGRIAIKGELYKDAKCFPTGARLWDWNETGTKHSPGIQVADVEELIQNGSEEIILSKGYHEKLQVHPDTLEYLNKLNIPFHNLRTDEAVKKYNQLRSEFKKVGGLFHSTC